MIHTEACFLLILDVCAVQNSPHLQCALLRSRLSEQVHLHLSPDGEVISVTVHPSHPSCPEQETAKVGLSLVLYLAMGASYTVHGLVVTPGHSFWDKPEEGTSIGDGLLEMGHSLFQDKKKFLGGLLYRKAIISACTVGFLVHGTPF